MKNFKFWPFLFALLLPQIFGVIGAFITASSVNSWYVDLIKPDFNPPNWLFAPVWISLFFLMGVASYLVYQKGNNKALKIYLVHLVFNSLWSILFFGMQSPVLAFIDILILLGLIIYLIKAFYFTNKIAGLLLLPYLLWVSFATVLNFTIWQLNS